MTSPDLHALTGAYALDALSADEQAAFEEHLVGCTECAVEVDELREAAGKLSANVAMAPPARLKADVMAAIGQVEQLPPLDSNVVALRSRRFSRRTVLTLAAAAVAVAVSGGIAIDQYRDNAATQQASDQFAALLAAPDARTVRGAVNGGGQATVVASNRQDAAVVVLHDLRALPSSQTYQLWLIDSAQVAHSVGLTGTDQTKYISGGVTGKVAFGLTVEPSGGSPKPTMPAAVVIAMA
ncbi:anti-sigma factor [Kribbella italica]|uniref:Regulator of SigK n=1 Tax=Kribbella italica TaxID=1540520 RepID=A0A7W9MYV4_9ACTN|nr:anti-sigma factor [Kribbella italica]MBB5841561.1 anti-sigma-K factor RskA [Kribbella italica]